MTIVSTVKTTYTNVYTAVATLCYGRYNQVDLIELCGGSGRISQVPFRRGLESGGNLDLTTHCDLGDPQVQQAVDHYLDTCHVLVAVLQPNCRTAWLPSYVNYNTIYDTWQKHHDCGNVALKQVKLGRYYLREQPGTWLDQILLWDELQRETEQHQKCVPQCDAGLVDEDNRPVEKMTECRSNDETLLQPFDALVCYKQPWEHGHPTGRYLELLKHYLWNSTN